MKIQPFNHSGLRVPTAALVLAGLLLTFLPDWGHPPRAQDLSSVSLTPGSHDYGAVTPGSSSTTTFTVQNGLLADVNLSNIRVASPFSAANGCPGLLPPGASCTLQVSFAPANPGSYSETLSITWSEPDLPPPPPGQPEPGGTLTANLTGSGATPSAPLTAAYDRATTPAGTPVTLNVLVNDTGGTPPLKVSAVTIPRHGAAAISSGGGTIRYTPDSGYAGPDSFSYTVQDAAGQTASAIVTVTVTPVAPPPPLTAVDDSATTPAGIPVTLNVLANDTGGTPPLGISEVSSPAHGTAASSGGIIRYTPDPGYTGPDSFSYTVTDAAGQTDTATVTITVTPVVPALTAVPDSATTTVGTPVTISVLANDTGGRPPLTLSAVSPPSHGTATISGSAVFYTPAPGYAGADNFSYTVRDAAGQIASATVSVTINPTPPPLIAVGGSAATTAGTQIIIDVLANVTGGVPPLVISAVSAPNHGTATINGSTIIYTPAPGYAGTDSFSYTVTDAAGQTASATITITVNPATQTPAELLEDAASTPNSKAVGYTIGTLCGDQAGSAQFLRDCNTLVDAAKINDPGTGAALAQITPNALTTAADYSQASTRTQAENAQLRLLAVRSGAREGINFEQLNIQHGGWSLSGQDLQYLLASTGGGGVPSAPLDVDLGPFGVFVSGLFNFGNQDGTQNQTGFDFRSYDVMAGVDYQFSDQLILGLALSYNAIDNTMDSNGGYLDTRGYGISLYGTYFTDQVYIDGMIGYGWNNYDQRRNVVYQLLNANVNEQFNSSYDGQQFFANLGAGYQFTRDNLTFGPETRLSYLNLRVDSFQEQPGDGNPGSAWAIGLAEQSLQSLTLSLGGRASYLIEQSWGVLRPQIELSWLHEFKDNDGSINGWFVQGAAVPDNLFQLLIDPLDKNYFRFGLGLGARFNDGPSVLLQYRALFGYENLSDQAISAQIRWQF